MPCPLALLTPHTLCWYSGSYPHSSGKVHPLWEAMSPEDSNYCCLASIGEKKKTLTKRILTSFHSIKRWPLGRKTWQHSKNTNFVSPGITSARGRDNTHKVLRRNVPPSTLGFLPEESHRCDLTLPAPHKPPIFYSGRFSKMMPWSLPSLISVCFCTLACLIIISCWQYLTLIEQPSRCSPLYNETSDLSGTALSIAITYLILKVIRI